jgi:hypothetical protein
MGVYRQMLIAQREADVLLSLTLCVGSGDDVFAAITRDRALESTVVAFSTVFEYVRHIPSRQKVILNENGRNSHRRKARREATAAGGFYKGGMRVR